MYRIAILGTENLHAINFAQLINGGHPMREGLAYGDMKVIGAYGYDQAANEDIRKNGGVEMIAGHYADFVGKVDAVMITARHGDNHLKYALPYLEAGIPMFIDKPITISEKEAVSLAKAAKQKGLPLCGGSCCALVTATRHLKGIVARPEPIGGVMGGSVCAPVSMQNDYGDFHFYSQHLVQIMLEIFGYDMKSVYAVKRQDSVTAICRYDSYDVTAHFGPNDYSAAVYGKNQTVSERIDIHTDAYAREAEAFADMLRTGRMHQSYEEFIRPVFVQNALKESMDTGREITVSESVLGEI